MTLRQCEKKPFKSVKVKSSQVSKVSKRKIPYYDNIP